MSREYFILKLFLVARNITFIGIIVGSIALYYGQYTQDEQNKSHDEYKMAQNYYKVGIVFTLSFILLRILVTFGIINQMQKYRIPMKDYLLKNMNILLIIVLNIIKIIGFAVVFAVWLKIIDSGKKNVVYDNQNINYIVFMIGICAISISWCLLFQHQYAVLEIYAQKWKCTQTRVMTPTPNEESPFNIYIYKRVSYV